MSVSLRFKKHYGRKVGLNRHLEEVIGEHCGHSSVSGKNLDFLLVKQAARSDHARWYALQVDRMPALGALVAFNL